MTTINHIRIERTQMESFDAFSVQHKSSTVFFNSFDGVNIVLVERRKSHLPQIFAPKIQTLYCDVGSQCYQKKNGRRSSMKMMHIQLGTVIRNWKKKFNFDLRMASTNESLDRRDINLSTPYRQYFIDQSRFICICKSFEFHTIAINVSLFSQKGSHISVQTVVHSTRCDFGFTFSYSFLFISLKEYSFSLNDGFLRLCCCSPYVVSFKERLYVNDYQIKIYILP